MPIELAFEAERLQGRERIEMPNGVLYVDTAEHTVLRKLEWYRRGGEVSERQWRDVQAIARIQGDRLDRDHLRVWAARLGVSDLLERVMPQRTHISPSARARWWCAAMSRNRLLPVYSMV